MKILSMICPRLSENRKSFFPARKTNLSQSQKFVSSKQKNRLSAKTTPAKISCHTVFNAERLKDGKFQAR